MARKFKTLRRYNDPGHAHALTFSCFRGQTFLSKDRTRRWFCEAVTRACEKHRFVVWAYVVMPEHVHLLVCPSEREYDAGAFCGSLKLSVSRKAVAWVRANTPDFLPRMRDAQPNGKFTHRFWQRGGGHDRNLFRTRTVHQQIEYIHLNPGPPRVVRAGGGSALVERGGLCRGGCGAGAGRCATSGRPGDSAGLRGVRLRGRACVFPTLCGRCHSSPEIVRPERVRVIRAFPGGGVALTYLTA